MKFFISLILLLIISGCSDKPKEQEVKSDTSKIYENQIVTIIVPNLGGKLIRGSIMDEAKLFNNKTGSNIRVVTPSWSDTVVKIKESLDDPKINFDIFVIISSWGGSLLGENHIAQVPDWVKDKVKWDDILPIYKNSILSWGNIAYGMPYDGDCLNLYYRKDIFEDKTNKDNFFKQYGYKLSPPTTWTKYEDIAKFFNGWDWDDDGKMEFGIAGSRSKGYGSILQFFARAAAYAKHPNDKAYYFDEDTMKPRINNPAFIKALEDYISVIKYAPKEIKNFSPGDVRKSFISGDVVMAIDWANMGTMAVNSNISVVKNKVGYAQLPGFDKVYNSKTKNWDNQYNNCSSISGNWTILVNKDSKNKKLAFDFASHMISQELTKKLITKGWTGVNPSRYSHFEDISSWSDSGFSEKDAKEYLNVLSKSLSNNNNMVDIRIPGADSYYSAMSKYVYLAVKGELTAKEALDKVAIKWEEITNSLNREKQIDFFKKSLNN